MELELDMDVEQEMRDLQASLEALNPSLQKHIYGEMAYTAARTVAAEAKTTPKFKDDVGLLRKSIRAKRRDDLDSQGRKIKNGAAAAVIGAPHGHLLEHGTADRTQETTGRRTGQVQPLHILRDALNAKTDEAIDKGLKAGQKKFNKFVDAAKTGKMTRAQERVLSQ